MRIGLIEDTRLDAELMRHVLKRLPDVQVLTPAASIREGIKLCRTERPDLVIVDWMLGDGDGCDLVAAIGHEIPSIRWLVTTAHLCCEVVDKADAAGAAGVIDKMTASFEDLLNAVETIAAGGEYYRMASVSMLKYALSDRSMALTPQQRRVIEMLADHRSRKEIGAALAIGPGAVSRLIGRIAEKLAVPMPPSVSTMITAARASGALPKMPRRDGVVTENPAYQV